MFRLVKRLLRIFLSKVSIPSLTDELSNLCEGELTFNECYLVIKEFEYNTSPGSDGLTAEFCKACWPLIGKQVVETLKYSYTYGELSTSQKQATITIIEKKDKRYFPNWRPISLLNVDAKITSKALARRLQRVLPYIIDCHQHAYVKGRSIYDAVRNIYVIMQLTKDDDLLGLKRLAALHRYSSF